MAFVAVNDVQVLVKYVFVIEKHIFRYFIFVCGMKVRKPSALKLVARISEGMKV